jgi:hypothetical protein
LLGCVFSGVKVLPPQDLAIASITAHKWGSLIFSLICVDGKRAAWKGIPGSENGPHGRAHKGLLKKGYKIAADLSAEVSRRY